MIDVEQIHRVITYFKLHKLYKLPYNTKIDEEAVQKLADNSRRYEFVFQRLVDYEDQDTPKSLLEQEKHLRKIDIELRIELGIYYEGEKNEKD